MTAANVTSVGALLPRDLLDRIDSTDPTLTGLDATDYGLVQGERVRDAVTRSWNRLVGVWGSFRHAESRLTESDLTATSLTRARWLRPLFEELGFFDLPLVRSLAVGGKDYPVSHQWGTSVPVHLLGCRVPVDRRMAGVQGAAKVSPHSLVQEFLNRSDEHLWGIVSNGLVLRLLRDNASLTRSAYCEFDLQGIFDGQAYSDFVLLWLLCHRTRFEGDPPEKCILEQWSTEAAAAGTRALDRLREGVEKAIISLGDGFLTHRGNSTLRARLDNGDLADVDYLRQLLRLVYRLIFLLVAESRDLLLAPGTDGTARRRYQDFYSVGRLRKLAGVRRGTSHDDLWRSLQITMSALDADHPGIPALGLEPLGSFLWSPGSIGDLNSSSIENRHLLAAISGLSLVRDLEAKAMRPVDYRNLGTRELGSVYESLLELHPKVNVDARKFELESAAGAERKLTGSYYTPEALIERLLDEALDPILDEAEHAPDPEQALLDLRVLDPACGSGHFLISAAHRIAGRLASVRVGGIEPTPAELRTAVRDVIGRCVYGIDINPMAAELCKVSLWLEANDKGRPLGFLDHHIVCGNSLLGTTPELLADGIPQKAFKKLTGDDPRWLAHLRKTNLRERKHRNQQILDLDWTHDTDLTDLANRMADINIAEDTTTTHVAAKAHRYNQLQQSPAYTRPKLAADAWCAAFVTPKTPDHPAITDDTVREITEGHHLPPPGTRDHIVSLADEYQFLHPHIAFPDIHAAGGFDAVVGNPPWGRIKLQEKKWFAQRSPEIASAPNKAARARLIKALRTQDPRLYQEFQVARHHAERTSALIRNSGRYPLSAKGDINTYQIFADLMRSAGRWAGMIVPSGIASDHQTKDFFNDLVQTRSLVSLYDFENRRGLFPSVHRSYKFCLLTLTDQHRPSDAARFVFFAHEVADIDDPEKNFSLTPDDLMLFNPNTRTAPTFRTRRDAEITTGIYRRVPVLIREGVPDGNPWGVSFQRMFDMSNDSGLFRTRRQLEDAGWTLRGNHFVRGDDRYLPLYVLAMVHQYDHRWATFDNGKYRDVTEAEKQDPTYVAQPEYWVPMRETDQRIGDDRSYLLGWRDVARSTDTRTLIFSPHPRAGAGNPLPQFVPSLERIRSAASVTAIMNSFACDYASRQKLGGIHLNFFYLRQLAVLPPNRLRSYEAFIERGVLELCYTAWDMFDFANALGWRGPPFRWDLKRRTLIRAEFDALMFHLYRISRPEIDYLMRTFEALQKGDRRCWGEYRTRRLVLERYDAMHEAECTGDPYQTVLDPPPADSSVAHDWATQPVWHPIVQPEQEIA